MKCVDYKKNYWMCDFETTTINTHFFKSNNQTRVWLAYAKCFGNDFENQEILTIDINSFFEEFWNKKQSATLFFHNLTFDGEYIKWYLFDNNFKYFYEEPKRKSQKGFTLFEDENTIYYIHAWKKVRTANKSKIVNLYIRCSLNLLNLSVDKLARVYGLDYKLSIDYDIEPFQHLSQVPQDLIDYIKRDVEIVISPLKQFDEVFTMKMGNRTISGLSKLTIGSVSLSMFKCFTYKKYNFKENFFLPYENVIEFQNWYSGGLCSFNKNYQYKPININDKLKGCVYDVNSMYPSVMVENYFPIGTPSKNHKPDSTYKIKMLKIFIKKAQIKKDWYPPLMRKWNSSTYTYEKNTRFCIYTENAIAYYFQEELDSLKRFYHVDYDIIDVWYFKGEKYFKDFINTYYDLRKTYKKSKDPREQTIKLLLNSAYGKFGQKPDKKTIFYSENKYEKGEYIYTTQNNNNLIVDVVRNQDSAIGDLNCYICDYELSKSNSINVAIASCITMFARVKLQDAIYNNIDNFIYCDTDSIFLKDKAKGIDVDENKLGAWKLEMEFDGIELGGAKLYQIYLKNVVIKSALSGMNKKWAKENLKPNDIITLNKKLDIGSKLLKRKVKGGIVLEETEFTIKPRNYY